MVYCLKGSNKIAVKCYRIADLLVPSDRVYMLA